MESLWITLAIASGEPTNIAVAVGLWAFLLATVPLVRAGVGVWKEWQDQRWRVYLAAGTGYFYDDEQIQPDVWQTESHWNYGAGVGLEYLFGRRWSAQFEGDFAYHGDSGDITVVPQLGIYYYW